MDQLLSLDNLISLLTLTFLEIVLGIDNIIFISITASRLPLKDQSKARNIGLLLAMVFRVILLFGISILISLQKPFAHIDWGFFKMAPIHHHFELKGWPEPKIIVRFWIISIVLALICLTTLKLR